MRRTVLLTPCLAGLLTACVASPPPATAPRAPGVATASPPATSGDGGPSVGAKSAPRSKPASGDSAQASKLSPDAIAAATGGKPEVSGDVIKVSFPRADVPVDVDGTRLAPFLGLTSWVAFTPAKSGSEAMVMGDLVLFADEVNPVMSVLLEGGVQVTALHNHFFFDQPRVMFMHVSGEGSVAALGGAVKRALDVERDVRKKAPTPGNAFGTPAPPKSALDPAPLDAALGVKGTAKDGMYKAVFGRTIAASCGCPVGAAMGVNTWAGFAGTDDDALVDGDFAVLEEELQPVLRSLRASGVSVVAIHNHMTGETPRTLFLHYWGRGKAIELARAVKRAVDLTDWDGASR